MLLPFTENTRQIKESYSRGARPWFLATSRARDPEVVLPCLASATSSPRTQCERRRPRVVNLAPARTAVNRPTRLGMGRLGMARDPTGPAGRAPSRQSRQALGVQAVSILPSEGRELWQAKYSDNVIGFDTHCTSPTSRLFLDNGWELVGQTKGYSRDGRRQFSRRATEAVVSVRDNAGLVRHRRNVQWWTWVLRV